MAEFKPKNTGSSTDIPKGQNINFPISKITNKKMKDSGRQAYFRRFYSLCTISSGLYGH